MSNVNRILTFIIGLIVLVIILLFINSRLNSQNNAQSEDVTPTPTQAEEEDGQGFDFFGLFRRNSPTPSMSATPTPSDGGMGQMENTPQQDIVQNLSEAGEFNTLITALEEANLVGTLQGPGPFTVFAPTDAAFNQLPEGTLDSLLANPEELERVLLYHVVSGRVNAEQAVNAGEAQTLNGQFVQISQTGSTVLVNNAVVTSPDVESTNGIIHVIDSVLIPADQSGTDMNGSTGSEGMNGGDTDGSISKEGQPQVGGEIQEIPRTGAPTLLIPFALSALAGGMYLRRSRK